MQFDDKQLAAIERGVDPKVRTVATTGAAGTGKTTIMRQVYEKLSQSGLAVALAAPTGKAAKRITQATGIEAQTLHRLLEYTDPGEVDPKTGKASSVSFPRRTEWNPIEYQAVLVDEYAMVSTDLHNALMKAMPRGCILRVFGDTNQLAPIEEGIITEVFKTPFEKLLSDFDGIRLETIHRQGEGSGIVSNGWRILRGSAPMTHHDFDIFLTETPAKILGQVMNDQRKKGVDYTKAVNQIITPSNKGICGTISLNQQIQSCLYNIDDFGLMLPRFSEQAAAITVHVGDKVIFTKNNYDLGVMNGNQGVVTKLDPQHGNVVINFEDRGEVDVPKLMSYIPSGQRKPRYYDPRKSIDLAYAVTTHKCQGSEFDNIIYVISDSSMMLCCRRNFYTAITRARKHATIIASSKAWRASLKNMDSMI